MDKEQGMNIKEAVAVVYGQEYADRIEQRARVRQLEEQNRELLEALRECVTDDNASGMQPGLGRQVRRLKAINDIARAAIAKATGGAL